MSEGLVIEANGLTKVFGDSFKAVDGVDFYVRTKEIFGFLGPNGAGKTTTIKMLCTLLKPTSGTANVDSHSITTRKPTLEDVFLYFTGRQIRESEATPLERIRTMRMQMTRGR